MRIAFIDATARDYTPATPLERPLGGMQSGLCYLSSELATRGHEVRLFNNTSTPGRFNGVDCRNFNRGGALPADSDVIVGISSIGERLRKGGITTPAVYWTGHDIDQAAVQALDEKSEKAAWTAFAFKSEWQCKRYVDRFAIEEARTAIMRNAASPAVTALPPRASYFFEEKRPPILAYTSTPFRGLRLLLRVVPTVRRAIPGATARVYSSLAVYGKPAADDEFGKLYDLCRETEGIEYVGSVPQPDLARGLGEADIFAYPSIFAETSCISLMEAAIAGCLLVTMDLGALAETGGGYAHLLGLSGRRLDFRELADEYAAHLVKVIRSANADPAQFRERVDAQVAFFRNDCNWRNRATEWEAFLGRIVGGPQP
jgi:glycosyltransferase involved in cell wall biosynthesis